MRFADVIGNEEAIASLREMVDSNRIPHAILLSGPSGIGKMILARAFISYINCENPRNGDSCGVCPSCRRMEAGNSPDIHYIYPIYKVKTGGKTISESYLEEWHQFLKESPYMDYPLWMQMLNAGNSQPQISVEESDRISAIASLSSYSDRFKIFLIWLPEKMGTQAANKILKVLEEPFEDTLFICVSDDAGSILPTIYSRLRRVEMRRPSSVRIVSALKSKGISDTSANTLAHLSEGSLLKAFQLAQNQGETEEFGAYFRDIMRNAYARKVGALKGISENLAGLGREKTLRLLDYFSSMTRENFIANLHVASLNVMTPEEEAFSGKFAPFINAANVEDIIKEIDDAKRDIRRNANGKLVWFDFALRLMVLIRKK